MRAPHLAALAALLCAATGWSAPRPDKVRAWAWDQVGKQGHAEVLIVFGERPDLRAATAGIRDRVERRRAVVAAMREASRHGQAGLGELLTRKGVPFRSFVSVNAMLIRADAALLREIAARPEVDRIVGNPRLRLDPPERGSEDGGEDGAPPWGVDRIKAPVLWAMGYTGQGIVIGGQDTGVRWTHEALKDHYRGWDGTAASHDHNWHDAVHVNGVANPCGVDSPEPCDDFGHGTHTVGTAGGGTVDEPIGVAPGSRWIACRNMDGGVGTPATYIECFDFFLAPWPVGGDPSQGNPAYGPDVTINSWVCPPDEGCDWDTLQAAVDTQRAAGIFTEASAGNSGPGCGTVDSPPATYASAFSIGASNAGNRLAGFSSRGPGNPTGLLKPDVVAPGVSVRSATAVADDSYDQWSGTSMAGPHAAGAVALLWSAAPVLQGDIDRTEELLRRTARPLRSVVEGCGGDYAFGPNNSWGKGLIDLELALAALNKPPTETVCNDGLDDDGDGFTDCADNDCAGAPNCPEAGNCLDYVDNDLDGKTDCADPDCAGDPLCPELGNCADGLDNDLDGDVDCADRDCDVDPACPGLAIGPIMLLQPAGTRPTLAEVHDPACRYPSWRICPESILPGTMPGAIPGEALPFTAPALRLYQHSDGDLLCTRSGDDLAFEAR